MPMQVFEFQADTTVSLVSPAAIDRKSCDHCFLNRKTCDKVRQAADSGEKCMRCAKDNRPCTFTPTVHLYHIADCVGRHQCRAKVIQAMGGRKKEVQFKTIEIPIVCDMDSALDLALFDFIQKQPNLLVYNNRIKSFLAQDMLGVSPDHDDASPLLAQYGQSMANYGTSPSARSFVDELTSYNSAGGMASTFMAPTVQIANKYPLQQQQQQAYQPQQQQQQQQAHRAHPYANHQRTNSNDRRGLSPTRSPRAHPVQSRHNNDGHGGIPNTGRISPLVSPTSILPMDVSSAGVPVGSAGFDQRRQSDNVAAAIAIAAATTSMGPINSMGPYGGIYQQQQQQQTQPQHIPQPFQQQTQHPYAQQSPYPQATFFPMQSTQGQPPMNYRNSGSFPSSPLQPSPLQGSPLQGSSQPPSPLDLSLGMNTNLGPLSGSHQNLPSLFDSSLSMGGHIQQQQQQQQQGGFHRRQLSSSSSAGSSSLSVTESPSVSNINMYSHQQGNGSSVSVDQGVNNNINTNANPSPPPLVVPTVNEHGHQIGLYYAVPTVNLNPGASDADLFHDFTMMDDPALGEDFVWIENLFDETSNADIVNTNNNNTAAGNHGSSAVLGSGNAKESAMDGIMAQYQQQQHQIGDQWSSQYTPQGPFDLSGGRNLPQAHQG